VRLRLRGSDGQHGAGHGAEGAEGPSRAAEGGKSSERGGGGAPAAAGGGKSPARAAAKEGGGKAPIARSDGGESDASNTATASAGSSSLPVWKQLQRQGAELVQKGDRLQKGDSQSLQQAHAYFCAALTYMKAVLVLEKQGAAQVANTQALCMQSASVCKKQAAGALEDCERYAMAAACYKCAGACTMRAFRLQHKESSKDGAVALKRAREEEASSPKAVEGKARSKGESKGEPSQSDLFEQLGRACSALEAYDKGASMQRAFPDAELQSQLPALEGFAAMATLEVVDVMEAVLSVMVKLMKAEGDGR